MIIEYREKTLDEKKHDEQQDEIELPQEIVVSFARFLVPEIRKYYESEQGQREFKEWQEQQKTQNNR
ncbi:hypothetical protein SDC9_138523 [bioreactor metagenome]|uniref:Uncharacterized protein n=1 Tax=bioreactor metagenome TaxID=1076179 RepID=A0A645DQ57_9ZZZZ